MRARETVARLSAFEHRGAGTDAERRAAVWLAAELERGGRAAELETFWCRPNWALACVWHVALGLAGSLVSVSAPVIGAVLVLIALLSVVADALLGISPGRRLTPERASQNVLSTPRPDAPALHLILTANYDAGRTGLAYRAGPRRAAARLRRMTGAATPGWTGWLAIALAWLLAIAIARTQGAHGSAIGVAQLIPTAALVLALALVLDLAGAEFGPAASDNPSGVALALALVRALDVAPPRRVAVDVVLQGAGDGSMVGLRRYLRARRRTLGPRTVVVIGLAPCGAGRPRWWTSDGALLALRYAPRLVELSAHVAQSESHLGASAHRARGASPALPARAAGLPAITIGCLDENGLAPRSHQASDTADTVDSAAMDATLELALALVDALDADLAHRGSPDAAVRRA